VVGSLGELGDKLVREGVLSGLVDGSSTDGVEEDSELVLQVVGRVLCKVGKGREESERGKETRRGGGGRGELTLDPDEGVGDESLGVVRVGGLGSRRSLSDVPSVLERVEAGEEVSRVKNEAVSSDLTERDEKTTRPNEPISTSRRGRRRGEERRGREEELTRIRNW